MPRGRTQELANPRQFSFSGSKGPASVWQFRCFWRMNLPLAYPKGLTLNVETDQSPSHKRR
jgi:hypothetical protein